MLGDENASLLVTIDELRQVGIKLFFNSLSCYAATLLDMVDSHICRSCESERTIASV